MQKKAKRTRNMKVYRMSVHGYKPTPTIMLKDQWLKELGFDIGSYVSGIFENGKLIITLDAKRAIMKKAEAAFLEREAELLRKRFEAEKE